MKKSRSRQVIIALSLAVGLVLGSAAVPSAAVAGGPPVSIPGKSSPAPKPKAKSCPWYKPWC